jgi:membrane protease YdiL (CAAX protease family)
MAVGWSIRPLVPAGRPFAEDPFAHLYLLVGIPLTVVFQVVLRRQPLRALWVRDAPPIRLGKAGICLALGLMLLPASSLVYGLSRHDMFLSMREALILIGAVGAAYALRNFRRPMVRLLVLCLVWVTGLDIVLNVGMHQVFPEVRPFSELSWMGALVVIGMTVYYLPVCFVLEEVTFRGALDAHLHKPGEAHGWLTAIIISAIWGLWHLPMFYPGSTALPVLAALFLVIHITVGVPLSLYWRRTGNLAVPALAHGLIDAVRDALILTEVPAP